MLDGELVALGDDGISNFQKLQNSLEVGKDAACVFFAFDLMFVDGHDVRALPLLARKQLLEERLARLDAEHGRVRYSAHVVGDGPAFFQRACELGLEGSVAKRADSPYVSSRTKAWLKIKCTKRQEFVIGGYTEPSGSRGHFGALLLGVKEDGRLMYAGKVGTGFTAESLRKLWSIMKPLEQSEPAFHNPPKGADRRGVHWLSPRLVAEVQFAERTTEGLVRHASFQGLREDKQPDEVREEKALPSAARRRGGATTKKAGAEPAPAPALDASRIRLTHPDRVLYPEQGLTKRDLALYYARVSACMLPHVTGRPIMLVRCPEGASGQCFHQKHPSKGMPKAVERVLLPEKKGEKEHLMIRDVEGLIGLVQMGALEIHTWGCRVERVECPDQLVFDLDPDAALGWDAVVEAAQNIRERLRALRLHGFLKTTGGKGLHVVVPVEPVTPWDDAKEFTRRFVEQMVREEPDKYLMTMTKHKRVGKIFLDYLRNGRGATAVCAFSSRARPGAPVSAPISWDELGAGLRSDAFDVQNMSERLATLSADPWRELESARSRIPKLR
jgi:bifunctional non-homologous end joining protein LigD